MTKTVQHISLKKSTIKGKAPLATDLVDGELAVNIAEDGEKIFLKNTANKIVGFSADGLLDKKYLSTTSGGTVSGNTEFKGDVKIVYPDSSSQTVSLREVMVENEMAISAALNDLNTRVNDQKTDIDTIKAKECLPLSGGTVSGNTEFKGDVKIAYPDSTSQTVSLREVMVGNEEVTSAALNELNERISDQKADIDTIKAKECLPLSGGTINGGLIVSGNTEFKGDVKIVYPDSSSQTVSLREVMVDNEMTISAALNDLSERIEDQKKTVDSNSTIIGNISTKVNELLPLSGGTVSGETTFTKDTTFDNIKLKYPKTDSEAVSLRDVMLENEKVTAAALNDLNERVNDHKSDIDAIKIKECLPLSGGTVSGITTFTNDVKIAYPDSGSTPVSLRKVMFDNEEVIAAALNDLNDKVANIRIINAPLIIKDGNKKYNVNIAKGIELGLFTEIQ